MIQLININYSFSILVFFMSIYVVFASEDLMKKLFALSMMQTSVLWFYISLGKIFNATPPILNNNLNIDYSNPLPQVLMLTAIVVGAAIISLGFALVIKIRRFD